MSTSPRLVKATVEEEHHAFHRGRVRQVALILLMVAAATSIIHALRTVLRKRSSSEQIEQATTKLAEIQEGGAREESDQSTNSISYSLFRAIARRIRDEAQSRKPIL